MCSSGFESVNHLFSSCPYAAVIRNASPSPLSASWDDFLQGNMLLGSVSRMQQLVSYLYLAIAVHTIWLERNARLHQSRIPKSATLLIMEIKGMAREKLYSCSAFKKACSLS